VSRTIGGATRRYRPPGGAHALVRDDRMTISATDVAFFDLSADDAETETVAHELHDAVPFVSAWPVIEIEDAKI